jgi:hypothetical protein
VKLVDLRGKQTGTGRWDSSMHCHCCGMSFNETPVATRTDAGKGIRVLWGKHLEEGVYRRGSRALKETVVKHVETKQGIITVITRSAVNAS